MRTRRKDLEWVFSIQHERRVNPDNTIALDNRILQIEKTRWRNTLAGCNVRVYEFLAGTVVVRFGPHEVARWAAACRRPSPSCVAARVCSDTRDGRREPRNRHFSRGLTFVHGAAAGPPRSAWSATTVFEDVEA